ncbi:unnamed protein product [Cyprideis torosa]|uniref:Uncharacterized protein n=1 Tax=Cyprideis torosa TaxID=163714 RepID=A0A7R8W4U8_9CRUS|nr:unnamed protein product [Cyprideis torosa]CAG0882215.1 unnamed protein product [Cyprideis torosa]
MEFGAKILRKEYTFPPKPTHAWRLQSVVTRNSDMTRVTHSSALGDDLPTSLKGPPPFRHGERLLYHNEQFGPRYTKMSSKT